MDFELSETLTIEEAVSKRIDAYLAKCYGQYSRSHLKQMLDLGHITVSGKRVKATTRLNIGDTVQVNILPVKKFCAQPEDIDIEVLFEDEHMLAVNKPAPMVVYPSPGHHDHVLVNAVLNIFPDLPRIDGDERPGIVHRLDKETSGVILLAKTEEMLTALQEMFRERRMSKQYVAITTKLPNALNGTVTAALARSNRDHKKIEVNSEGKDASTRYSVLARNGNYGLVHVFPKTGRMHQVRVHLQSVKAPVLCDKFYNHGQAFFSSSLSTNKKGKGETPILSRHALHASQISFTHPLTSQEIAVSAPMASDMQKVIDLLFTPDTYVTTSL